MVTGRNVWMGLLGGFIYDDPVEQSLDLPQGPYDVPLMVTDREFDSANQIPYTFVSSGTFGDVILVNGVPQPYQEVGDRRYRFRLYNVSNRRDYTFRLSNGQAMTQIGTDSGLLPAPVSRTRIRLGPAERADVVIDFAGHLNEEIVLENTDADLGPGDRDGEVMQFRVTQDVVDDSSPVPATLRPVFKTEEPVTTRTWDFDRAGGEWTINGKRFDPERVDARPELGTTERWTLRNPTTLPHLAHIHLADQKLVSRNGQPPPAYERVKETWYLAPGDEVVIDVKFSDYVGKFILHCHVLEHEDKSMMTQFETVLPPRSDPGPDVTPAPTPPDDHPPPPATERKRPAMTAKLSPRRDKKAPFRFTATGRLKLPGDVANADGCGGQVMVKVQRVREGADKTVSSRRAAVRPTCRYTSRRTFSRRLLQREKGTLKFILRFQGNEALKPRRAKRRARFGR